MIQVTLFIADIKSTMHTYLYKYTYVFFNNTYEYSFFISAMNKVSCICLYRVTCIRYE